MVFTASKHGPEGYTPLHTSTHSQAGPAGGLGRRWGHRRGPLEAPEHTFAHADTRDTGTLESVSEQSSNSGISKQVGQKIFFFVTCFFFLLFLFVFFVCFFLG